MILYPWLSGVLIATSNVLVLSFLLNALAETVFNSFLQKFHGPFLFHGLLTREDNARERFLFIPIALFITNNGKIVFIEAVLVVILSKSFWIYAVRFFTN